MGNFFFVVFGGLLLLFVILAIFSFRADRKRSEAFRQAADEMGLEFMRDPPENILRRFPSFHLFSQGHSPDVRNLLRGKAGGLEVSIFDYSYVTGGGKSRTTWRQTVVAFEFDDIHLPPFSLRPEMWFHKVGQWFGFKDIDFDSHPQFSKKYLLRSSEEEAVRALFNDHVLEYYEANPDVCTEAFDGRLVYYRGQLLLDPAQVRSFLEQGFQVLALFRPPKE